MWDPITYALYVWQNNFGKDTHCLILKYDEFELYNSYICNGQVHRTAFFGDTSVTTTLVWKMNKKWRLEENRY